MTGYSPLILLKTQKLTLGFLRCLSLSHTRGHTHKHTQINIEETCEKGPHTASVGYLGRGCLNVSTLSISKEKNSFFPFQSVLKDFSNLILKGVELQAI